MAAAGDSPDLPPLIPGLPDEISLNCLARVPLSSRSVLSLVSKSWLSILRSPLLFTLRSDLHSTQPLLLLNLRITYRRFSWFLLDVSSRPIRFLPLPSPPLQIFAPSYAVLGPRLYLLGGSIYNVPSPAVQILDARHLQWALGPNMSASREYSGGGSLSGLIYAFGGCPPESDPWAECFDPATGQWAPVPSPAHLRDKGVHVSAVLGGKLLAKGGPHKVGSGVAFDPTAGTWTAVTKALDRGWKGISAVVEGILISLGPRRTIQGYDPVNDTWRRVEVAGLKEVLKEFLYEPSMVRIGRLLGLVEERSGPRDDKEMLIRCAGIEVAKMGDGRLRGEIVWMDTVRVPMPIGTTVWHCVPMEL